MPRSSVIRFTPLIVALCVLTSCSQKTDEQPQKTSPAAPSGQPAKTKTPAIPFLGARRQAQTDASKVTIRSLEQALKHYAIDHDGRYPEGDHTKMLDALVNPTDRNGRKTQPYLEGGAPKDAWGNPIHYEYPSDKIAPKFGKPAIWSAGPNGKNERGQGDDVTNWADAAKEAKESTAPTTTKRKRSEATTQTLPFFPLEFLIADQRKAQIQTTKLHIRSLENVVRLYAIQHDGSFPEGDQTDMLDALVNPKDLRGLKTDAYLEGDIPKDAWDNPIYYEYRSDKIAPKFGKPAIWSAGPNGKNERGKGDDIANWGEASKESKR